MRRRRLTTRSRIAGRVVAVPLLAVPLLVAAAPPEAPVPDGPVPDVRADSPGATQGEAAVAALGARLDGVAADMGLTPAQLRTELVEDATLFVDAEGMPFYVRPANPLREDADLEAMAAAATVAPLADTFTLHSRPGADRTIYIDVDGHDARDSIWGATAPPYDADGNPNSFSSGELATIQQVWELVAEDYAPFDVDVTTEEPPEARIRRSGSSDQVYGTRAVVTPGYIGCGSCGGIAYVGVFDALGSTHDRYQPAWVFTRGVGTSAKGVAEALSHEVGHNLGLGHDGTSRLGYFDGHGDWAPIMGVGYREPITQWSKGEYADASNQQDDLAVMRSNGAPNRSDDHGATLSAATRLSGNSFSASGVIGTRGDVDGFRFELASASRVSLDVTVAAQGPNLDARLDLYDASGTRLARVDPASGAGTLLRASGLDASLARDLPAGTYRVTVDGVGKGSPATNGYSDYASLGAYRLSGTVTPDAGATRPPKPSDLRATSSRGTITVVFTDNTGGTAKHRILRQRQVDGRWTEFTRVATLSPGTTRYTERPGPGRWRYWAKAVRDGKVSPRSNIDATRIVG